MVDACICVPPQKCTAAHNVCTCAHVHLSATGRGAQGGRATAAGGRPGDLRRGASPGQDAAAAGPLTPHRTICDQAAEAAPAGGIGRWHWPATRRYAGLHIWWWRCAAHAACPRARSCLQLPSWKSVELPRQLPRPSRACRGEHAQRDCRADELRETAAKTRSLRVRSR